jgi:diguanylate cyclase (GGDEF)-like protein
MFTRKSFQEHLQELQSVELRMMKGYSNLINQVDDDELRLKFTALMQAEQEHHRELKQLEDLTRDKAEVTAPNLKWSIGKKVGLLLIVIFALLAGALIHSAVHTVRLTGKMREVADLDLPLGNEIGGIQANVIRQHLLIEKVLRLHRNDEDLDARLRSLTAAATKTGQEIRQGLARSAEIIARAKRLTPEVREQYGRFALALGQLENKGAELSGRMETAIKLLKVNEEEIPEDFIAAAELCAAEAEELAGSLNRDIRKLMGESGVEINSTGSAFLYRNSAILLGVSVFGILLSLVVVLRISASLAKLTRAAREVTAGFISNEAPKIESGNSSSDEVGLLDYFLQKIVAVFVRNLEHRRKLENELELLATTDKLTNALNRHKCDETLEKEIHRAARYKNPLSILLVDIDRFRQLNDAHGHEGGDQILGQLGRHIKSAIRDSDFLFRYGGEEFLILIPNTDLAGAGLLAEKLREMVAVQDFSPATGVTISIGVAQLAPDEKMRELVRRAEDGMRLAKSEGRNRTKTMPA